MSTIKIKKNNFFSLFFILATLSTFSSCFSKETPKINTLNLRVKYGTIKIKLLSKKAPNTVKRISKLANNKFYNGITFHRVIPGFVAQAGDPTGTGMGGSGKKLNAEFNDIEHVKGTVAMARKGNDVNSADSQFYISLNTLEHLNGKYTVFGQVIEGMDLIDKIKKGDKIIEMTAIKAVSFIIFNKNKLFQNNKSNN